MCLCLQIVYVVYQKRPNSKASLAPRLQRKNTSKENMLGFRVTAILIFLFIILHIPTGLESYAIKNFSEDNAMFCRDVAELFRSMNSTINVLVYAAVRQQNRKVYIYLLTHRPTHWKLINDFLNLEKAYCQPLALSRISSPFQLLKRKSNLSPNPSRILSKKSSHNPSPQPSVSPSHNPSPRTSRSRTKNPPSVMFSLESSC